MTGNEDVGVVSPGASVVVAGVVVAGVVGTSAVVVDAADVGAATEPHEATARRQIITLSKGTDRLWRRRARCWEGSVIAGVAMLALVSIFAGVDRGVHGWY